MQALQFFLTKCSLPNSYQTSCDRIPYMERSPRVRRLNKCTQAVRLNSKYLLTERIQAAVPGQVWERERDESILYPIKNSENVMMP